MKRRCLLLAAFVLLVICVTPLTAQDRDLDFEQEIYDRLAAIDPDAVPLFQSATQAMDAGDYQTAQFDYERVLELAPDFPDAMRRLSYVLSYMGDTEEGLALARATYAIDDSPFNRLAVAQALIFTDSSDNHREALIHAKAVVNVLPDDENAYLLLLYAGILNNDEAALRQASAYVTVHMPDVALGHYVAALIAADDSDWEKAEYELDRATDLGYTDVSPEVRGEIVQNARPIHLVKGGLVAVIIWLAGMVVLFVAGSILSRLVLTTAQRPQTAEAYTISSTERLIRRLYRVVIALTSLYFYISIPILVVLTLAAGAGVLYGLYLLVTSTGRISGRLVILVLVLALGFAITAWNVIRSVFTRIEQRDPGDPLKREAAPELWALCEAVAARVGTRPIDAIYLVPGTQIGVTERGGIVKKLQGGGQRYLILGLGALNGLTQPQFKAILAHEYGHFNNRDTAGGELAFQVQMSIINLAQRLGYSGQARWYNPAWLFVNGFYRLFLRITLGASRLQEVLADRYAAMAYGAKNFAAGLQQIIRQSIAFDMQVNAEIKGALETKRDLQNLYVLPDLAGTDDQNLDRQFNSLMQRPTSPYDSHPAVKDRLWLVEQLRAPEPAEEPPLPMWDLLPDAEALQRTMTATIAKNVEAQIRRSRRVVRR